MNSSDCGECKLKTWKYKCPGCSIRSCGLPCVKAHKHRTGCNGKRKVTDFVTISQFGDNLLLSDYRMLEEAKRVAESAQRRRNQICKNPYFKETQRSKLRAAAARGRTNLMFLSSGMLNREMNQTRYDNRSKCISWTIEWRFHSTDVVLVDHGLVTIFFSLTGYFMFVCFALFDDVETMHHRVGEDTSLCSVIENHLKPGPWIHKLKPFCDVDLVSLKLFIPQYPKGVKAPYKELDIKAPLRQQLAKVAIVEYPVIHVYLPSQSYDFEVVRDFNHLNPTPDPKGSSLYCGHSNNTKGIIITSGEEEIKEDYKINSFEPEVPDIIKQVSEDSKVEGGVTKNSHTQVDPTEQGDAADNMELEFEQGLIDTYSDLFAEMDPGDYFNFKYEGI
ncbi:hypothetical protein HA466_0317070 [Hirschfeldia incana]|nr:hypothetical protein HA466_0317070 [Hirschfeldia incana]